MYTSAKPYFYGTGRRKSSVARVRIYPGTGNITINGRDVDDYFGLETLKLIITFHTTTDAMAMESACKAAGADGRLIPVPQSISAGCGLAWSAKPESEQALLALMLGAALSFQDIHICLI